MQISSTKQHHLVSRLRAGLILPVSLLIIGLILSFAIGIFASISQYNLGEQKVAIRDDLNGILRSMLDQESGLRGYINTNNTTFLEPFTNGRPQYLAYMQHLKDEIQGGNFNSTSAALAQVDNRASQWYNNYALVQVKNIQNGNLAVARAESTSAEGKAFFDAFRSSFSQLQQVSDHDVTSLQTSVTLINISVIAFVALLLMAALIVLWRTFQGITDNMQEQLTGLEETVSQIGGGNLSARVGNLSYRELDRLGQTFNSMAAALQEQQNALQERDILGNVLQLNSILTKSLDLEALAQEFLSNVLSLLEVQVGALYLYDEASQRLTLFATQGVDSSQIQREFQLGEGLIGHVAQSREPLYLTSRGDGSKVPFTVKTMLGAVLPTGLYQLPLVRGHNLFGVLAVSSVYPMNEKSRNILNVVSTNLAAALINTQAYRRIQEQTEELGRRSHEQEEANIALRRQRDDLTILNAALEEANKARSQFLSTMSHELRTPLTSIIGFSQILLRGSESTNFTKRQRNNIERILKNGHHLLGLINDVLDLAKIEAGRMDINYSQMEVKELLSAIVDETQSIAVERGLLLKWHVSDDTDIIETDPFKLRQILLNLISNSLKFTEKGEVTVTAACVERLPTELGHVSGNTDIGENLTKDYVALSVKDTGIGISKEMQERIFEAFYQVDSSNTRKYGGTGLGLSIVRELTTLLGGTLELQSSPGQGSTFTVYLPVKAPALHFEQRDLRLNQNTLSLVARTTEARSLNTSAGALEQEAENEPKPNLVLAIDDNPDVLNLINNALENSPFELVGVNDPTKAVEMVQELQPSAVTLDVMMPNINGWQILYQLKSNPTTANIPIIMLTVLEDRSAAYVLGADEYLVKPIERDSLLHTLRQLALQHPRLTARSNAPVSDVMQDRRILPKGKGQQQSPVSVVLVVEDEQSTQAMLKHVLSEAGLNVEIVSGSQEALHAIQHSRPDVVVLHLTKSDIKNSEVLRSLIAGTRNNKQAHMIEATGMTSDVGNPQVTGDEHGRQGIQEQEDVEK